MSANGRRTRQQGILAMDERPDYGVIATLENRERTVTVSREFGGVTAPALYALADYCDRHAKYVTCLSTPNTILMDVRGRIHMTDEADEKHRRPRSVESSMLQLVGRADLLHPAKR